jgi:predicted dehydrogenase
MTVRFGLLGTGPWATSRHGPGLVTHPGAELVGIWGRTPAHTAAAATSLGTTAYDDLDRLLDAVDAVSVALPPDAQAELAVRAARAGCHLLLDKPLALSDEAADAVVEAAEDAGVASVVFFTAMFRPELDSWYEAARAGTWAAASVTALGSAFGPDSPYKDSQWRHELGALWDSGPHALSYVIPALGPVTAVAATDGLDGVVNLTATHESGATSTLALSISFPAVHREAFLFGTSGVLPMPAFDRDGNPAFTRALSALLGAIDGRPDATAPDVRFGRDVVHVLSAAERARRQPAEPVKLS